MKKNYILPVVLFSLLIIIITGGFITLSFASKRYESARKELDEFINLMNEYESIKAKIDLIERRLSSRKIGNLIEEADRIINSKGLKERLRSIKPVSKKEVSGMVVEEGELNLEKLSMNEFLNLVYQFSEDGSPLKIKRIIIKRGFVDRDLLDVSMLVSSVHKEVNGGKR